MKTIYTHNEEALQVTATRSFAAPRAKVWSYFTTSELLDQWWAPAPYIVKTKSFDFREGGHWHYAMQGPEGDVHWCMELYHTIAHEERFTATDAFCDETGVTNPDLPTNNWDVSFLEEGEVTQVVVVMQFKTEVDMKTLIEMGFEEGFNMGLDQLTALLTV
jgi:uncharacterized protein YndB with AHSA1/START domain